MLELIEDFAEVIRAMAVREPFGSPDGAERKSAPAEGVVAEFDDIVWTGGCDDVFALGIANTVGANFDTRDHSYF